MSDSIVKETMASLKKKNKKEMESNEVEIIDADAATPVKTKGRKNGGGKKAAKNKTPKKIEDDASDDETRQTGKGKTNRVVKKSTGFKNKYPDCACSPRRLNRAYKCGENYCRCGEVPLYNIYQYADGSQTFEKKVDEIMRKYCKPTNWSRLNDKPNIVYYDPYTVTEPTEEELEAEKELERKQFTAQVTVAGKNKRPNPFIGDEAEESDDDGVGEETDDGPKSPPTKKASKPNKKKKTDVSTSSEAVAEEPDASENGSADEAEEPESDSSEQVDKSTLPNNHCPFCGDRMNVSTDEGENKGKHFCMCGSMGWYTVKTQDDTLARYRVDVLDTFKPIMGGSMPNCEKHQYPCKAKILRWTYVDKNGKPIEVSEEKKQLEGRIFAACAAPKQMRDEMAMSDASYKECCHFFKTLEFEEGSKGASYFEDLYKKIVVAKQKTAQKATKVLDGKMKGAIARVKAQKKAKELMWKKLGII